jgi:hypothetical protein
MGAGRATVESEHCRAICDEIGDRFREILSRDAPEPSAYLLQLLSRFEQEAPSVVPTLEDMQRYRVESATEWISSRSGACEPVSPYS